MNHAHFFFSEKQKFEFTNILVIHFLFHYVFAMLNDLVQQKFIVKSGFGGYNDISQSI